MSPLDFTCPHCGAGKGRWCLNWRGWPAARIHKGRNPIAVRVKDDPKDVGYMVGREVYWPDNVDTVALHDGRMFDSAGTELEPVP